MHDFIKYYLLDSRVISGPAPKGSYWLLGALQCYAPKQDTEGLLLVMTGSTALYWHTLALHWTWATLGEAELGPTILLSTTRYQAPPRHNLQLSATPSVIS